MNADTKSSRDHSPWPTRAAVLAAIATLIASIGGLYYNGQSTRQATELARQAQTAQTSERFSRSVEQLGSETMTVRIGAIHSFGRLMRDSGTDQLAIGEILSSFVLSRTAEFARTRADRRLRDAPLDVVAAIRELDSQPRPRPNYAGRSGVALESRSMYLSFVLMSWLDLKGIWMRDADLTYASFRGSYLSGATMSGAQLRGANLSAAYLEGVLLSNANLLRAVLVGTRMASADLTDADLTQANLTGADLYNANLQRAKLTVANLSKADLTDADLTDSTLVGTNLSGAKLTRTDLTGVVCSSKTIWPDGFTSHPPCSP